MSLTGNELTLNDKSYSIKDKNGNDFHLGKLLKREKAYSPFHESYSLDNNIFEFENAPDKNLVPAGVNGYCATKMFDLYIPQVLDKLSSKTGILDEKYV